MTTQILCRDDLRSLTPSVFATTPWEGMSDSYRFIPTAEVLDMMTDQGFRVTSARQSRSRIEWKAPFTRHMLRLRHESVMDDQGEVPEVVLVNSHDRSSAYRVFSGVFRLVCENGMIVQSADFGSFSIRHSGSRGLFQQVREATTHLGRPVRRDRLQKRQQYLVEQFAVVTAIAPVPCRPPPHQAQPLAVPEGDVDEGDGNSPPVGQPHGEHGCLEAGDRLAKSLCLTAVALGKGR